MDNPASTFWQRNKLLFKSFFIAFLILALLIPTFFLMYLVNERKDRKQEVTVEVSNKWSASQTIAGPFLTVPYIDVDNKSGWLIILPERLEINGTIVPKIKSRSIFNVPVYTAEPVVLSGSFSQNDLAASSVHPTSIKWNEAKLCVGLTDLKGLKQQSIKWNGQPLSMHPGIPENNLARQGISSSLSLDSNFLATANTFSIELQLQGSENLYCTPLGDSTSVHFVSTWPSPAFDGHYLPDTEKVSGNGFEANWVISQFNRDYPKIFAGDGGSASAASVSSFGVKLIAPFDAYAQTLRSLKYAILIIALTFFTCFFTEIIQKRPVHPLQYILIGISLVIFYALLLSFSEYIQFPLAYLIAAASTIVLLSWYAQSIFRKIKPVVAFAGILTALYSFIYILIQMEDNALLFGSIGLFLLIALAMYLSRKIDWYNLGTKTSNS